MFASFGSIFLFLLLQSAYSDPTTSPDEDISDIFETASVNITQKSSASNETVKNGTVKSQPSQSQKIELTVLPEDKTNSTTIKSQKEIFSDFRPSPQLEPYYEFNKFPVPPAYPEAKHVPYFQAEEFSSVNKENWNVARRVTTDQPWTSNVKFPTANSGDRPYSFMNTGRFGDGKVPENVGFSFNKPVPVPEKSQIGYGSETKSPAWEKHTSYGPRPAGGEYNLLEKPPTYGHNLQKTYESGLSEHHHKVNPWKKVIKFLTAFIPIGLLISALTPTVITVTTMNDTQSRYRATDAAQLVKKQIVTSLDQFKKLNEEDCEDRVLCELLLIASNSKNGEQHVRNLLDNFAEHEKDIKSKADELKKVFDAVKNQNCDPIQCKITAKPKT